MHSVIIVDRGESLVKYGLWIAVPDTWNGWFGVRAGNAFFPMQYDEDEARQRVDKFRAMYPTATVIEARPSPPDELPWSQAEWLRHKAGGSAE